MTCGQNEAEPGEKRRDSNQHEPNQQWRRARQFVRVAMVDAHSRRPLQGDREAASAGGEACRVLRFEPRLNNRLDLLDELQSFFSHNLPGGLALYADLPVHERSRLFCRRWPRDPWMPVGRFAGEGCGGTSGDRTAANKSPLRVPASFRDADGGCRAPRGRKQLVGLIHELEHKPIRSVCWETPVEPEQFTALLVSGLNPHVLWPARRKPTNDPVHFCPLFGFSLHRHVTGIEYNDSFAPVDDRYLDPLLGLIRFLVRHHAHRVLLDGLPCGRRAISHPVVSMEAINSKRGALTARQTGMWLCSLMTCISLVVQPARMV